MYCIKGEVYFLSVGPIVSALLRTHSVNIENHTKNVPPFVYRITLFNVSIYAPVFNYRGAATV